MNIPEVIPHQQDSTVMRFSHTRVPLVLRPESTEFHHLTINNLWLRLNYLTESQQSYQPTIGQK